MKSILRILTPADKILVVFLVTATVVGFGLLRAAGPTGKLFVVRAADGAEHIISLAQRKVFHVDGPAGGATLEVRKGGVRVVESGCRQKICVRQGRISKAGQIIVCVPNRLVVIVKGSGRNVLDAVTG